MRKFTLYLPSALMKLETLRLTLESHGISTTDSVQKIVHSKHGLSVEWAWRRGEIEMRASLVLEEDDGGVLLAMSRPNEDSIFVQDAADDTWMVGDDHYRNRGRSDPLKDLSDALPDDDLGEKCSEPVARKAINMIVDFFAKLPIDPPAEAAVGPTL